MSNSSRLETASNLLSDARHLSRQIWLAGLGAYTKAGQESLEYLKDLVQTGAGLEGQSKAFVSERVEGVSERFTPVVERYERVKDSFEQSLEKVEAAFDLRVARGLNRLGLASRQDVTALSAKLDVLSALVAAAQKSK